MFLCETPNVIVVSKMSVPELFNFLTDHKDIVGIITVILSLGGFIITWKLYAFISKSHNKLAKDLSFVYFWDSAKFLVTLCFGLAALYDGNPIMVDMLYWLRPFILAMLIFALWRLYKTFKLIGKE